MPGIPLVVRETTYSRGTDQMCRQDSIFHLSAEEEEAAEQSFSIYCKPVELYNILQRRAIINPSFLQRCLHYKIQAKHKTRIQMTISLSATLNNGLQNQNLFPLRILLARPVSNVAVTEHSAVYRFNKECILTSYTDLEGIISGAQAKFILPEFNKLTADIKAGSLTILFVSCVESTSSLHGIDQTSDQICNGGGYCLLGKIPMELLYFSWEKSPNLSLGDRAEMLSTIDMDPCFAKFSCYNEEKSISFHIPHKSEAVSASQQLAVIISGEEVGAKEEFEDDLYSYNSIPTSLFPRIIRLRAGNVIFNYWYYGNKLQRTEVTEDFSCAFCSVKCPSFKGLKLHLSSSHDLFSYDFWANEEYRAVNVSVRTDICYSEVVVADTIDPKEQTFYFCSKQRRKAKRLHQSTNHVHPLILGSDFPVATVELQDKTDDFVERETSSPNMTGMSNATAQSYAECAQSVLVPASSTFLAPAPMLQFAKTRKLSVEQSEPKTRALLQRRKFFHSHRAQSMSLEQVLSDQDSEDEVDDDVADLEDRRMLDDFVDVTKDEKQIMHLWNSFVRKQRVLADSHIPWACEAFSRLHGQDFVRSPPLLWCWRLFMIKLWNHGLLDARTMNNCNVVLEQTENGPMRS